MFGGMMASPVVQVGPGSGPEASVATLMRVAENASCTNWRRCSRVSTTIPLPIGQTTQALVYVPDAVPVGSTRGNLSALAQAGDTARLRLRAADTAFPNANASVAVNSLGLLDLVQIAAVGLAPPSQYEVYLADLDHAPFGKLVPLATLRTNPDGAGIVQTVGPLKVFPVALRQR